MNWFYRLFHKSRNEAQLDKELRFHLERQIAGYIAAGMSAEEARRRARLEFGGLERVKDEVRDTRSTHLLETLLQDIRYAFRMLGKNLGFTLAAAITLALGIGSNTAIFSIVNASILRPLPYKDSSRIVSVHSHTAMFPAFSLGITWPDFQQIHTQAASLGQSAAYTNAEKTLTGKDNPVILNVADVSDGFFEELGVTAAAGRLFNEQDQIPGQGRVVVLSDSFWRTRFGADPSALGSSLILDKEPYTVVGIAPRGFSFPEESDAWLPLSLASDLAQSHTFFAISFIGKLRQGERMEHLRAELDTIAQRTTKDVPELSGGYGLSAEPLLEGRIANMRTAYLVLLGAAALVLLISCANLASLLLARGSGRQREMALRAALGASRGRLLRQGLVESCLLALLGGGLGILLAAQGVSLFRAVAPANTPRLAEISVDSSLLWVSLITSLAAGVLFGLVPARRAARMDPNDALKEGSGINLGAARSARQSRLGDALVVMEVALAFVLIVGSTLMTQTVSRLLHQELGFRTDHLLSFELPRPSTWDPTGQSDAEKRKMEQFKNIVGLVQHVPGVAAVTASGHGLLTGMTQMESNLQVDAAIPARPGVTRNAKVRYVFPSYFQVLGIPLLRGREFTERDAGNADPVVVVNETMAREYWGNLEVLGKRLSTNTDEKGKTIWNQVIGVVADTRDVRLRVNPAPTYFRCSLQGGSNSITLLVRTLADPDAFAGTISRQIWSSYPDQPVTHVKTISRTISESIGDERLRSILLLVFAGIGFALALVGVYGVISYSVAQRVQEIGIRMTLGAAPADVLRMILRQGLLPVAAGVVIGAAAALALARAIASQFYGVQPTDPATFLGAAMLVLLVASLACGIPAHRATRVDPLVALRYE
jgi:predicted permease